MNRTRHYNAALIGPVIGAWQGRKPPAIATAPADYGPAIIERAHVGGSCANEGCTQATTVASARAAYLSRRASDYGVGTAPVRADMEPGASASFGQARTVAGA